MSKWVVVEETDDYISCAGVFSDYDRAICEAYVGMSRRIDDADGKKAVCSALYDLEADSGVGFHYEVEGYGKVQIYILEANEDEKAAE